jgi:phosphohistidine phosphatase SixA
MRGIRVGISAACLVFCAQVAAAQQVIFVVRHAERADNATMAASKSAIPNDVPLSDAGKARAVHLAAMLRSAGITHVFTTEFKRTRETAEPLATAQHIKPVMAPANDVDALVAGIKATRGASLVVGHSDTVPEILKKLGVKEPIMIGEQEYDNLFVVIRNAAGTITLVRLRY